MPLKPPPRDADGNVIPHNHEQIEAADGIIRRISENFLRPGPDGKPRVSTMALQCSTEPNGGMSVDIEKSIVEAGVNVRDHVTTPRFIGSVRFTAGDLRQENLMVGSDPLDDNAHHGEVWGKLTRGVQNSLLRKAVWLVQIDGVTLN